MQEVATYPKQQQSTANTRHGLTSMQKIGLGVAGAIVLGLGIRYAVKAYTKSKANAGERQTFQEGGSATIAKQLQMTFENDGNFGTNVKKLREIMTGLKSKDQWSEIEKQYEIIYNEPLAKKLKDELQASEYDEMLQIKEAKPQKAGQKVLGDVLYRAWAKRLKAAFDKTYSFIPGTDEPAVKAVFNEVPTQRAFINVGRAYGQLYKVNLIDVLKSELEIWEYDDYMKIILKKPQA